MVVDFNKFAVGEPLKEGTLWVVEEIPGLVAGGDQTETLARGYWPSYNVPFYAEVYVQPAMPPPLPPASHLDFLCWLWDLMP